MILPAERPLPGLLEEHPELASYPSQPSAIPPGEIVEGSYAVRYARDPRELDELLRLRFRVFNLELAEGLEASYRTGRDLDRFDAQCHHLIVLHRPSGRIIGTYRIQTTQMAEAAGGFYTATEFDLSRLPREILDSAVEVGRACIEREHRLKPVLFLLWKGLARYMEHNRRRFLLGPCSLTSQDPWDGKRALDLIVRRDKLRADLWVGAQPGFECVRARSASRGFGRCVPLCGDGAAPRANIAARRRAPLSKRRSRTFANFPWRRRGQERSDAGWARRNGCTRSPRSSRS